MLEEALGPHVAEERKTGEGRAERIRKRKSNTYKERRGERKKEGCTQIERQTREKKKLHYYSLNR